MRISTAEFVAIMAMLVATVAISIDGMLPALSIIIVIMMNKRDKTKRDIENIKVPDPNRGCSLSKAYLYYNK